MLDRPSGLLEDNIEELKQALILAIIEACKSLYDKSHFGISLWYREHKAKNNYMHLYADRVDRIIQQIKTVIQKNENTISKMIGLKVGWELVETGTMPIGLVSKYRIADNVTRLMDAMKHAGQSMESLFLAETFKNLVP